MTSNATPSAGAAATVVRDPVWAAVLMWVGLPVAGAVVFWLLKQIAGWVAELPGAPFQGLFELAASAPEPWATVGAVVLGAGVGFVLALIGAHETLQLTVSSGEVRMKRMDVPSEAARADVASVFLDGKQLVLLGSRGEELAREKSDLPAARVRSAFESHGYPWVAEDPYKDQYRLWVEDLPDLPPGANPVLKARAKALEKDSETDARELRVELVKLGVVVREQKKRQYIRVVT
jgi:hypothetical protein